MAPAASSNAVSTALEELGFTEILVNHLAMPEHASVDSLAYLRDWTSLPSDILKQIVPLLDKQAQGSARLACKTWQHTVEASINDLHLG